MNMPVSTSLTPVEACMSELCEMGADDSLLLWLRLHRETLEGVEFAKGLYKTCAKHGITRFGSEFLQEVKGVLVGRDILPSKSPVVAMAMRKDEAVGKFQAMWTAKHPGVPVQPFCFQTANGKNFTGSVFVVVNQWSDGLYLMLRIETDGFLRCAEMTYPVSQLYEHQVGGDQRIARVIFDWELQLSFFKGRRTLEQVWW